MRECHDVSVPSSKFALVSVGLALVLTGCSDDSPAPPEAGQCFAQEVRDGSDVAPDFGSEVSCTEPHVYEVVEVLPIPDQYLSGESDDELLENRSELADVSDAASDSATSMREEVYPRCSPAVRQAAGLSDLTAQGATADELDVSLSGLQSVWFNLTSPEQWVDGQTDVVCMIRYQSDSDGDGPQPLLPVTSPDERPLITRYTDGSVWPTELRTCFAPDAGDDIACDEPHDQEVLFRLDARAALGESFLRGEDLTESVDSDDADTLFRLCGEVYGQLGHAPGEGREYGARASTDDADAPELTVTCTLSTATDEPLEDYTAFTES